MRKVLRWLGRKAGIVNYYYVVLSCTIEGEVKMVGAIYSIETWLNNETFHYLLAFIKKQTGDKDAAIVSFTKLGP